LYQRFVGALADSLTSLSPSGDKLLPIGPRALRTLRLTRKFARLRHPLDASPIDVAFTA